MVGIGSSANFVLTSPTVTPRITRHRAAGTVGGQTSESGKGSMNGSLSQDVAVDVIAAAGRDGADHVSGIDVLDVAVMLARQNRALE